jgi:hypothetical protein
MILEEVARSEKKHIQVGDRLQSLLLGEEEGDGACSQTASAVAVPTRS